MQEPPKVLHHALLSGVGGAVQLLQAGIGGVGLLQMAVRRKGLVLLVQLEEEGPAVAIAVRRERGWFS